MQHTDTLERELEYGPNAWRYQCTCGYETGFVTRRGAELARNVHRHRHLMGTAGTYHIVRQ